MQKILETILVAIVFYGIFSALDSVNKYFELIYPTIFIVLGALLCSSGLILWYSWSIRRETRVSMNQDVQSLRHKVQQKDKELTEVYKIKKAVEQEAEMSIPDPESREK